MHAFTRSSGTALRVLAAACALAVCLPAFAQDLGHRIETIIERSGLHHATIGVSVMEIDSGQVIASYNADDALIPASNMKLLTSGAAAITLGDDFSFRTQVLVDRSDGTTRLILVGSGDPGLGDPVLLDRTTPPMDIAGLLERMALAARRAGVEQVDEVIVDARVFDRERTHESWPDDQLNRWYCAEVAGVNLHTNVATFYIAASKDGVPDYTVQPDAPWLQISNRARSIARGQSTVWIARPRPENAFTLYGKVRGRQAVRAAIAEPARFGGGVLAEALKDQGVRGPATGDIPVRLAGDTERFDDATPVVIVTTSIADALARCNKDSHNLYAEALVKRIGHQVTGEPGSWANGTAVVRMLIGERLGPNAATGTTIADGSGLSRDNRVSPQTLSAWLTSLADDSDVAGPFIESLPGPGEGTLRARFQSTQLFGDLRAKSGYLRGVYALSGYLLDPQSGEPEIAFAIILNDVPQGSVSLKAKPLHESIVAAADDWLEKRELAKTPGYGG